MNYIVFLEARAGELEKILSGVKSMVTKEFNPAQLSARPVRAGDWLYFIRNDADCALRVKAHVVSVRLLTQDVSHALKELQAKLQLTEEQFNDRAARQQFLLVEFDTAHKIDAIQVPAGRFPDHSDWIAFEELNEFMQKPSPEPGR